MADASVRVATPWDVDAVGAVQAALWREAYASLLPAEALDAATAEEFARVWRESLANPPSGAYRLLVACAGEEVVGFAAVGPSADPDATDVDGELLVGGVSPGCAPYRPRVAAAQRDGRHGGAHRVRPGPDVAAGHGRADARVPAGGRVRPRRSPS